MRWLIAGIYTFQLQQYVDLYKKLVTKAFRGNVNFHIVNGQINNVTSPKFLKNSSRVHKTKQNIVKYSWLHKSFKINFRLFSMPYIDTFN